MHPGCTPDERLRWPSSPTPGRDRRLKATDRRRLVRDDGARSLYLVVQPSGHKSWLMRFRRPGGKPGKIVLGPLRPLRPRADGRPRDRTAAVAGGGAPLGRARPPRPRGLRARRSRRPQARPSSVRGRRPRGREFRRPRAPVRGGTRPRPHAAVARRALACSAFRTPPTAARRSRSRAGSSRAGATAPHGRSTGTTPSTPSSMRRAAARSPASRRGPSARRRCARASSTPLSVPRSSGCCVTAWSTPTRARASTARCRRAPAIASSPPTRSGGSGRRPTPSASRSARCSSCCS